jgi:hypothetical protein
MASREMTRRRVPGGLIPEKRRQIPGLVDKFLKNVDVFLENVDKFLKNVDVFLKNVDKFLKNVDVFLENVDKFLKNVDVFLENVDKFLKNVDVFLKNVDKFPELVDKFSRLVDREPSGGGSFRLPVRDTFLYTSRRAFPVERPAGGELRNGFCRGRRVFSVKCITIKTFNNVTFTPVNQ